MTSYPEKAVQALLHGHRCATRLKMRLDDLTAVDGVLVSSEDLAKTIVDCFSDAISELTSTTTCVDQSLDFSPTVSSSSSPPPPRPFSNHQRVSPKKRKTSNTKEGDRNWRDDSPVPIFYDDFLWRKYGQKKVKGSEHHRSYYRCAYMEDDDCKARKQIQKIKEHPPVYRTTYFGCHACRINQDSTFSVVSDPNDEFDGARIIKFGEVDQESNYRDFPLAFNRQEIGKEESVDQEQMNQDQEHRYAAENQSPQSDYCPPPATPPSDPVVGSSLFLDDIDLFDYLDECSPLDQFDFAGF